MKDPLVEEVWKIRDDYAKQFNYNLDDICQDLRKKQQAGGRQAITLEAKRVRQKGA